MYTPHRLTGATAILIALGFFALTHTAAANTPFDGIVTRDDVAARAGGDAQFYAVGHLERGTPVRVIDVVWGWNRVEPPEGVHSFIRQEDVERDDEDDSRAHVTAEQAEIRAAGLAGESEAYRVQGSLAQGEEVQIVEEQGPYYRIVPPADAHVYLPPGSVERASQAQQHAQQATRQEQQQQQQQQQEQAAQQTTDTQQAEPEPDPEPEAQQASADPQQQTDRQRREADIDLDAAPQRDQQREQAAAQAADAQDQQQALAAVDQAEQVETVAVSDHAIEIEQRHVPHFDLPVDEQPLEQMRDDYESLLAGDDLPSIDRRVAQARLNAIEHNERIAETLTRIRQASQDVGSQDEPIEDPDDQGPPALTDYTAIGELRASSVYDGNRLPRLLRLVDLTTGRTLGYVQPDEPVQTRNHLGQAVGIVGQIQRDPGLNVPMIEPERIDILRGQQLEDVADETAHN